VGGGAPAAALTKPALNVDKTLFAFSVEATALP
jgi:hypothetical protein